MEEFVDEDEDVMYQEFDVGGSRVLVTYDPYGGRNESGWVFPVFRVKVLIAHGGQVTNVWISHFDVRDKAVAHYNSAKALYRGRNG